MTLAFASTKLIAQTFTDARRSMLALDAYPSSERPATLAQAYEIQDAAIDMWPQKIAGWKIGGIGGEYADELGAKKLAGPVFEDMIFTYTDGPIEMAVFADGFAAIEPEVVMIVAKDAPPNKTEWTLEEAQDFVGAVHIGVEIASSPFPGINDNGPLVTISDFGNNYGLIIGKELENYAENRLEDWSIETIIEGKSVGKTTPPGPLESFRFILENTASRGHPLKKGMAITTGAITGVHQAFSGQSSTILCNDTEVIHMKLVPAIKSV